MWFVRIRLHKFVRLTLHPPWSESLSFFLFNKTGKNLLLGHNIPDNVYASFDDEELADFRKNRK